MRILLVPALVAVTACSIVESFDGYTSSSDGGATSIDGAFDGALGGGEAGSDAASIGAGDAAALDAGFGVDGGALLDGGAADSASGDSATAPDSSTTVVAYVYAAGGVIGSPATQSSTVGSAPAYADGTLGAWTAISALPVAVSLHGMAVFGGAIYVFGGTPNGTSALTSVYSSPASGGTVSGWTTEASMGTNRYALGGTATGTHLYAVGGHDSSGPLAGSEGAAPGGGGAISTWSSYSVLPTARVGGAACAYNGYLFLAGGSDDGTAAGASSIVYSVPINSDGSLGNWTQVSILITRRWGATCAVVNGRLYVLGGQDINGNDLADVQFSTIGSGGSLGSWTETGGFSPARFQHATVAIGNYLYVVGGLGAAGPLPDVDVGEIAGDGTIAGFTATTPLPGGRAQLGAVAF